MLRIALITFFFTLGTGVALAADEVQPKEPKASRPPPPPLPQDVGDDSNSLPDPEITIIEREDRTVEEYRVNGQLRYVKIIPIKGPPYYFVDTNGDGVLDKQFSNLDNPPINQWILLQW